MLVLKVTYNSPRVMAIQNVVEQRFPLLLCVKEVPRGSRGKIRKKYREFHDESFSKQFRPLHFFLGVGKHLN